MNPQYFEETSDINVIVSECSDNPMEQIIRFFKRHIARLDVVVFGASFVLGLLIHLYMFTHKFINHDDINGLYSDCDFGLSSGRWLLKTVTGFLGSYSSSWLNGLAGILFLSVAVVFVVKLFRMRHAVPAILLSLTMVAFPTVASTYAYMFCSYQYLFALMCAAIAAYLIYSGQPMRMALGVLLIAAAMGCYQAYFSLATVLLVSVLGMDLCHGRFQNNVKGFLLSAIKCVLSLAAGMILYMAVLKLCLWYTGTELTTYQGINDMGNVTLEELWLRVQAAYKKFVPFYTESQLFHRYFPTLVRVSWALDGLLCIGLILKNKLYQSVPAILLLIAVGAVFPLSADLVYVMAPEETVHLVMCYALVIPLILPAIFADHISLPQMNAGKCAQICKKCSVLVTALLLCVQFCFGYECFLITNRAYFSMDVTYENAYAYYVKLAAKIEMQAGYTTETPIAFIGNASMDNFTPPAYMTGVLIGNDALNIYSRRSFLSYFLASNYPDADQSFYDSIWELPEYEDMPYYPAEGSIRTIDGVIVVKLS